MEKRRTRGDLIEAYKIKTGKEAISVHKLFEISSLWETELEGMGLSFIKQQTGTLGKRFLGARVVNPWNELDEKTVAVDTAEKLKRSQKK